MLDLQKTQRLMELYLKKKLKERYSEELLAIMDVSSLAQAIHFYHELCGEYLNLTAVASSDEETRKLHKGQETTLFELLDSSLRLSEDNNRFSLSAFDKNQARSAWLEKKGRINFTSLRDLHADSRNLGIAEKFLSRNLHGQEWLTELDLSRLVESCGLKDQVAITRLNPADIGMVLHFHRKRHEADPVHRLDEYRIPFLLNKGSTGDVSSQGSHWTQATIIVNPETRKVEVSFKDSLRMSELEKDRIKKQMEAAVNYSELSQVGGVTQRYQAFPGYQVEVSAESTNIQGDSWSCGYRALKNVVDDPVFNGIANAPINKLKSLQADTLTSANLRDACYETLLGSVQVSKEAIASSGQDQDIFNDSKEEAVKIKPEYLAAYLKHVGAVKPNRSTVAVSASELKELQEIEELAKNYFAPLQELVSKTIAVLEEKNEEEDEESKFLTLDMAAIFASGESSKVNKAKIKALMKVISTLDGINALKLVNTEKAQEVEYFAKEFDRITGVKRVEADKAQHLLASQLEISAARNRLAALLKIELNPEEDPWSQLWQKRISNGSIYGDVKYLLGILALASQGKQGRKINPCVQQMGGRYLDELFRFIGTNKGFFEAREAGFPYRSLCLGSYLRGKNDADAAPAEYAKLNGEYLDELIRHLKEKKYFPFKDLELYLNNFTAEDFEKLKTVFELAAEYPQLEKVYINLTNEEFEGLNLTGSQYAELIPIFDKSKAKFILEVDTPRKKDPAVVKNFTQLQNIIVNNRRDLAIKKREGQISAEPELDLAPGSQALPTRGITAIKKVRPYKNKDYQVRSNLTLEVNVEEQLEQQQQHQLQTQLQQEVQQEAQVQEQELNEINSFTGDFSGSELIDREKYVNDHSYENALMNSSMLQSSALSPIVMNSLGGLGDLFWSQALGGHDLPQNIKYFTASALSKIHSLPQHFWSGFNMDNLPIGFFVQQHQDGLVLSYDETKYVENKNLSPLTLQLKSRPVRVYWQGDLRVFIPKAAELQYSEEQISKFGGVYSFSGLDVKEAKRDRFYSFMEGLNENLAKKIKEKHGQFFEPAAGAEGREYVMVPGEDEAFFHDGHNIYALMDLMYVEGCEGVMVFLDALKSLQDANPSLYVHFKKSFIDNQYSVRDLMTPANLDVIRKLASLPRAEREWWKHLVSQHKAVVSQIDLAELYHGYQYFLTQLPKGVSLPIPCPLENSGNMLLALDRLLSVLGKVKPRNLRDQLENLQDLSFDQEGAWYAARWDGYHYFHSAMKLKPAELNKEFEEKILGRKNPSYKVTFEDLKKVALSSDVKDLAYPLTLFHRYLGGADRLQEQYQYYLGLTQLLQEQNFDLSLKTKLLGLLALTTTGEQVSEQQDPEILFKFIAENKADLDPILSELLHSIDKWEVKPTLNELTSLIKLMQADHKKGSEEHKLEDEEARAVTGVLQILTPQLSRATWQAVNLWEKNVQHLEARAYLDLYQMFEKIDKDNIGLLAKIAGLIKPPYLQNEAAQLSAAIAELKTQNTYIDVLKILASIDLTKTNPDRLPSLAELTVAVNQVKNIADARQLFPRLTAALPGCHFDRVSGLESASLDLNASMLEKVAEVNEMLLEYGLEPLEAEKLKSPKAAGYIQNVLEQLEEKAISSVKIGGEVAWAMAKNGMVYNKIVNGLKGVLFANLSITLEQFPALQGLQQASLFPEPALSKQYDKIGEDFVAFSNYVANEGELFEMLNELKKKWPDLTLDFLMNSPRTQEFTLKQLKRIISTFKSIESSYIPTSLLKGVFSDQALGEMLADKKEELVGRILYILELKEFSLAQRSELIEIISKAKDPAVAEDLVKCLREIKNKHPSVLSSSFKLFSDYFKARSDKGIIRQVNAMLQLVEADEKVKNIIFNRLSDRLPIFQRILNLLPPKDPNYPESQQQFLKIIAFSCLDQEEDAKHFAEQKGLLERLNQLLHDRPALFKELTQLYAKRPYPKLLRLNEFLNRSLAWTEAEVAATVRDYVAGYELDPPGFRPENLDSQFDYSSIHIRIDQIRDLLRDTAPIFYSQKKELLDRFVYINNIGRKYNLLVPGDLVDKAKYQKPIKDLLKGEIQDLIQHYRKLMSSGKDNEEVQLAKLEFVALARESMYRATGKFPYSTQILSLLNVMLQGGNVFSEIRTGEGKGCITALFAAAKWMEGGAVDVCSSNMELAGRDLEEFNEFYEYLGIKTSLIRTKTKIEGYQADGINYSDVSELALFQEQMQLEHHDLPAKVSCVLDEADFIALDNTTQFRYATSLDASFDPHINPNEWAYPLILEFVASKEFIEKKCDKKVDIEDLRQYIYQHKSAGKAEKSKFTQFSDIQLDKWIDSAYTASQLVDNEDFAVRESTIVREGQNISVQVARVKINDRVSADSSFSNGVHQFLHTRLNLELNANKRQGHKFPIEPEKTYLASKSAKNFIDYYTSRGSVLGLTGTIGSPDEIQEMHENFGFKFFKIPPHKPLMRVDHGPVLAERGRKGLMWLEKETAEEAHFRHILKYVTDCQRRGQPALVICDGVKSSQKLHEYLQKALTGSNRQNLQLYNGEQLDLKEKDITDKAGLPGMVTISTSMLGRGTDIKPHYKDGAPIEDGLAVIDTFISADRDYGQKIGRGGRNGAKGDTWLVLSEAEFQKYQQPISRNKAQLNKAVEAIQARLNQDNMKERRERQYFADLKDQYFNTYILASRGIKEALVAAFTAQEGDYTASWKTIGHNCHLLWEQFLNRMDSQWNELLIELRNQLKADPTLNELEELRAKLGQLVQFTDKEWESARSEMERVSTEGLQLGLDALQKRKAAKSAVSDGSQLEQKTEALASIAPIKIPIFKAKAFLSPQAVFKEEIPTDTNYTILDEAAINEAKIYVDRVKSQNPLEKQKALEKEIDIVYSKLFQNKDLNKTYKKLFSARPDPSADDETKKVEVCLQRILQGYHKAATQNYDGLSKNHLAVLTRQLTKAIGSYEVDSKLKQAAYGVYKKHIQAHKDEGAYIQGLTREMHQIREWGGLEKAVDLSHQGIFAKDEHASWREIYNYALKQLDSYSSAWFKAGDRKSKLKSLISDIESIDHDPNLPDDIQKISKLIQLVNTVSQSAAETDREADQKLSKWSLFSYRNTEGSRFQDTLSRIHDKAAVYFVSQNRVDLDYKNELKYLGDMLRLLRERASLIKVSGNSLIANIGKDETLEKLISALTVDKKDDFLKNLSLISERLSVYKRSLAHTDMDNDSKLAFKHFFNDVHEKLRKFKETEEQIELSKGKTKEQTIYNSVENHLRELVQAALQSLVKSDHINDKNINMERYNKFVTQAGRGDTLVRGALFELERCLKVQFRDALSINMTQVVYDPKTYELKVKVELIDKNNENFTIDLTVNSLGREQSVKSLVLCQWPLITKLPAPEKMLSKEEAEAAVLLQSHKKLPAEIRQDDLAHERRRGRKTPSAPKLFGLRKAGLSSKLKLSASGKLSLREGFKVNKTDESGKSRSTVLQVNGVKPKSKTGKV